MSLTVLAFWLSLLIPGYAVARRVDAEGVESGLPAAIALSFIAAMVSLAAIMIPGYVLGVPITVLSLAIVAFVIWGGLDILRSARWPALGRLLLTAVGLESILIIADMVLGGRIGTILGADAIVHVARVRFLLGQGLSNADPFIGEYFHPIYHTNLIHGLLAAASQITRQDPLTVWFSSLPFAKLLVASGGWYAGWALFRHPAAGWVTALFFLGSRGPVTFTLYPNQLAPWFLLPVLVGYVARVAGEPADRRHLAGIAATSLAIGGTHGMYAIFATMAVGPAMAILAINRWRRRTDDRRILGACVLALAVGLPYPAVTHLARRAATAPAPAAAAKAEPGNRSTSESAAEPAPVRRRLPEVSDRFRRLDNGLVMHEIGRGFTGNRGLRVLVLAMAAALAVIAGQGRQTAMVLGIAITVATWLHVPPLCTLLLRGGGAEWIVLRFATFLDVLLAVLVPGSVIAVAAAATAARAESPPGRIAPLVLRWTLGASCVFAGAFFAAQQSPYDWRTYLDRGRRPASELRGSQLNPLRRFAADLKAFVPRDAVVLADPSLGMRVVMAHDCRVIASTSSSVGVPDLGTRTTHARRMLRNGTPEEQRDALLERYGVTHVVANRPAPAWLMDRMAAFHATEFGWCIITLRQPGDAAEPVEGDFERALVDAGRIIEAIDLLQEKVDADPEHFGKRFRLGRLLMDTGRLLDAIESFELALDLRPDDPRPAIMIGNAYAELEWPEEAIEAYRDTLKIAEGIGDRQAAASAAFNIGNTHYRLGRWAEAAEAYRVALQADPGHAAAAQWLAEAEARLEADAATEAGGGPVR